MDAYSCPLCTIVADEQSSCPSPFSSSGACTHWITQTSIPHRLMCGQANGWHLLKAENVQTSRWALAFAEANTIIQRKIHATVVRMLLAVWVWPCPPVQTRTSTGERKRKKATGHHPRGLPGALAQAPQLTKTQPSVVRGPLVVPGAKST